MIGGSGEARPLHIERVVATPVSALSFLAEVRALRGELDRHIADTRGRDGYAPQAADLAKVLSCALRMEAACARRYECHRRAAVEAGEPGLAEQFEMQAGEERRQAQALAGHIAHLGAVPATASMITYPAYRQPALVPDMMELIREDIAAGAVVIDSYRSIADFVRSSDPRTDFLLSELLASEQLRVSGLSDLVAGVEPGAAPV